MKQLLIVVPDKHGSDCAAVALRDPQVWNPGLDGRPWFAYSIHEAKTLLDTEQFGSMDAVVISRTTPLNLGDSIAPNTAATAEFISEAKASGCMVEAHDGNAEELKAALSQASNALFGALAAERA